LRLPNFWRLYGWDCRCRSFATRRTSWGKNSLVPISLPSSSPALARIPPSRPLLSDDDLYIKVKRTVGLSDRSDFKLDGIIAQHNGHSEHCVVADAFIPIYPNTLPTVPKPSSASRTASLVLNKLEGSQSAITRLLTVSGVRKTSDKGSNPSLATN
jgi:hypothetical protein